MGGVQNRNASLGLKWDYYYFPVELLKGYFTDIKLGIRRIVYFSCYYKLYSSAGALRIVNASEFNEELSKLLGCKISSPEAELLEARNLFLSYSSNGPMISVKRETVAGMLSYHSEFEQICFVAFLGIRSILQKNKYKKITWSYLFSRMSGERRTVSFDQWHPVIKKYATRHYKRRIQEYLRDNWHLVIPGAIEDVTETGERKKIRISGFYVGISISLKELILIILKNHRAANEKRKQRKLRKIEANDEAIKWLNSRRHGNKEIT
ncbi:hypothetical protein [Robertkochia flava]|uniref:hypothetical protein n=1 Tax=Robertkochia flava TaxID=3447986 RepID=UPI001CCB0874|nr:hypothetical protein [Robertkochia marina]